MIPNKLTLNANDIASLYEPEEIEAILIELHQRYPLFRFVLQLNANDNKISVMPRKLVHKLIEDDEV